MELPKVIQDINALESKVISINTELSTMLPLAGGNMSGNIVFNTGVLSQTASANEIILFASADKTATSSKSCLAIRNENHTSEPGSFYIRSRDTTHSSVMKIMPDGTFTWGGNHIVRSVNNVLATSDGNVAVPPFKLFSESGCNTLADLPEGFYYIRGDAELNPSDKPTSHWGMLICCRNGGTPFQIFEDDCSVSRWKRWYTSGAWTEWAVA